MTNTMAHVEELRHVAAMDSCSWDYAQKLMRSSADEIERLDADAAAVQAELESVKLERHQLRNELTAARLENQQRRALLVEVYNHGENSELHGRIGAALGAAPGEDASPSEPNLLSITEEELNAALLPVAKHMNAQLRQYWAMPPKEFAELAWNELVDEMGSEQTNVLYALCARLSPEWEREAAEIDPTPEKSGEQA